MEIISKKKRKDPHPYIPELKSLYRNGRITRREFLRNVTLLGLSASAAYAFAPGLGVKSAQATTIKRGGTWKCGMNLGELSHPARITWTETSNVCRQFLEYLTETGPDNITRPLLLEKWEASDDVKTWDLYLRKGIKFNNGDELTTDDVIFTMNEWFNKEVGSAMLGLLSYWGGMQNVEKVNDYHIRLHLKTPNIGLPVHLFNTPAPILHRHFEGDIVKKPVGTGPFTLVEYVEGTRAVFKRRDNYWRKGEDGQSLPYLDKVMYISMGKDAAVSALMSGQVDAINKARPADYLAVKDMKSINVYSVDTSNVYVTRMRVDLPPWNDNRVRTALKMCQDREKILQLAHYGAGALGIDAHVAPCHPEYCSKPIPKYDPEGARKLLQAYASEKGLKLPLKVKLATKNDTAEPEIAQTLKRLAKPAGFDIILDITEPSGYWSRWTEVDLGISHWTHRPLPTMILGYAYTKEAIGAWNETRWYDDEFANLLHTAETLLDVEKRREIMCKLEDIMQERGPVAISFWRKLWQLNSAKFGNVYAHPGEYHTFTPQMYMKS